MDRIDSSKSELLKKQVYFSKQEDSLSPGYSAEPLDEKSFLWPPGASDDLASEPSSVALKKYRSRVLLSLSDTCPAHCRYCFRRSYTPGDGMQAERRQTAILSALSSIGEHNAISDNSKIREVILSGGDPLSVSNNKLEEVFRRISELEDVSLIRIHSRFAIFQPQRIDDQFIKLLSGSRKKIVFVNHSNVAEELSSESNQVFQKMLAGGVTLLNQSVLLKGINDSSATLETLSYALLSQGVLPYYIHLLDRVQGAGHFEVDLERALEIIKELRSSAPGYLVPRLVREEPGAYSKTALC